MIEIGVNQQPNNFAFATKLQHKTELNLYLSSSIRIIKLELNQALDNFGFSTNFIKPPYFA